MVKLALLNIYKFILEKKLKIEIFNVSNKRYFINILFYNSYFIKIMK